MADRKLRTGGGLGLLLAALGAGGLWLAFQAPERGGSAAREPVRAERAPALAAELETAPPDPAPPLAAPSEPRAAPAEARAPQASEPVASFADLPPTSLGRLVDEATLEPIPEALVATSTRNDWTDANGWFDTGDALDGLDELLVVNVARGSTKHEVPRERWTRLARGWQIPLAIGPTYRLRVSGAGRQVWERWEGRLVQEDHEDRWFGLRNGSPPFLRYGLPLKGFEPEAETWLELRSQDGLYEGRAEVHALRGVHEVEVACIARGAVFGFVLDKGGAPLANVSVDAVQLSPDGVERLGAKTGPDGRYQLAAARPGRMQLLFSSPGATQRPRRQLDVPRGLTRVPDVVLASAAAGGLVRGSLQSRARPFQARVRLRALDGSGYEQSGVIAMQIGGTTLRAPSAEAVRATVARAAEAHEDLPWTASFSFANVPPGRYELCVVTSDGQRWFPPVQVVEAPAEGLLFDLDETPTTVAYFLEARDAETEQPLGGVGVSVRDARGALELDEDVKSGAPFLELVEETAFEWTATARGYAAAHGTERDFTGDLARRTARVSLRRGYSARLRFLDWSQAAGAARWSDGPRTGSSARGPAGVQVLADGVLVATSDAQGLASVELASEPEHIEVRLPGWRVIDAGELAGRLDDAQGTAVWMVRE